MKKKILIILEIILVVICLGGIAYSAVGFKPQLIPWLIAFMGWVSALASDI